MKMLKWLSVADRYAKADLDARLAPLGINSSQHMYLLKICNHPGILQDALQACFYVHPSNVVRTVAALEKKGFLVRVPYEQDKRTWKLYPTEKAQAIAQAIQTACEQTEACLTQGWSQEERTALANALVRVGKQMARQLDGERVEDEFDE